MLAFENKLRPRRRIGFGLLVSSAVLASGPMAHGRPTPEQKCQVGRAKAAANYASCVQKALANLNLQDDIFVSINPYSTAAGKCVTKYVGAWPKLQEKVKGTGATCDGARFKDNGNGTITDLLTALVWERKTDDAGLHDKDTVLDWSSSNDRNYTDADGETFTTFLAALNGGACFAGQCDWRLPTRDELLTIVMPLYPACVNPPCIDPALGPSATGFYWSANALVGFSINTGIPDGEYAWGVNLDFGSLDFGLKDGGGSVRAVRSGW